MNAPAFACFATAICFHGQPLQDADVIALRELYRDEVIAAFQAGDDPLYEAARSLLHEIVNAQEAQRQARKAVSAPRQTERKAA
jgi:hypothetical protein